MKGRAPVALCDIDVDLGEPMVRIRCAAACSGIESVIGFLHWTFRRWITAAVEPIPPDKLLA